MDVYGFTIYNLNNNIIYCFKIIVCYHLSTIDVCFYNRTRVLPFYLSTTYFRKRRRIYSTDVCSREVYLHITYRFRKNYYCRLAIMYTHITQVTVILLFAMEINDFRFSNHRRRAVSTPPK